MAKDVLSNVHRTQAAEKAKNAVFVGDLDLWPWPSSSSERGTKHAFHVNLAQICSAVPEIFHAQTKNADWRCQKQNLPQFTACSNYLRKSSVNSQYRSVTDNSRCHQHACYDLFYVAYPERRAIEASLIRFLFLWRTVNFWLIYLLLVTFRVSRRPREMYCGHARLCVCVSVCLSVRGRMSTLLHGPGCNLGEW